MKHLGGSLLQIIGLLTLAVAAAAWLAGSPTQIMHEIIPYGIALLGGGLLLAPDGQHATWGR